MYRGMFAVTQLFCDKKKNLRSFSSSDLKTSQQSSNKSCNKGNNALLRKDYRALCNIYNVRFWSARVLFHRLACWNACQGRAVKRASIHDEGDKRCATTQVIRLQQERKKQSILGLVSFAAVSWDVTQRSLLWGSVAWHKEKRLRRRLSLGVFKWRNVDPGDRVPSPLVPADRVEQLGKGNITNVRVDMKQNKVVPGVLQFSKVVSLFIQRQPAQPVSLNSTSPRPHVDSVTPDPL